MNMMNPSRKIEFYMPFQQLHLLVLVSLWRVYQSRVSSSTSIHRVVTHRVVSDTTA
jgi:hypothetical protein